MRTWIVLAVLLLTPGVPALRAQGEPPVRAPATQTEESIDSSGPPDTAGTTTAPLTTTSGTTGTDSGNRGRIPAPGWIHLVHLAATAGPIAFLLLAWLLGAIVHVRIIRREQEQFPVTRGSRAPQTVPMMLSAALFLVPAVLFIVFEVRSRIEIRRGIGGVVDEWQPVTAHAWTTLVVCLVLAVIPWMLARRADSVA